MKRKITEVIEDKKDLYSDLNDICDKIMKVTTPPPNRTESRINKINNIVKEYVDNMEEKHKKEVQTLKKSKSIVININDNMVKFLSDILENRSNENIEKLKIYLKNEKILTSLSYSLPINVSCKGRCNNEVCKKINKGIEYLVKNKNNENTKLPTSEISLGSLNTIKFILNKHSNRCLDDNCEIPFCVDINNPKFCKDCFKYHENKKIDCYIR